MATWLRIAAALGSYALQPPQRAPPRPSQSWSGRAGRRRRSSEGGIGSPLVSTLLTRARRTDPPQAPETPRGRLVLVR